MKELTVGVTGVLDGLGPGSTGRTGKDLASRCPLGGASFVGCLKLSISSSSSMEGNVCENSDIVKWDSCGEEDGDEVGDGGPSVEGDTKAC
jgi:hypothetical protein